MRRKTTAVHQLVMLGNGLEGPFAQLHAPANRHAVFHVLLVVPEILDRQAVDEPAHALGQLLHARDHQPQLLPDVPAAGGRALSARP